MLLPRHNVNAVSERWSTSALQQHTTCKNYWQRQLSSPFAHTHRSRHIDLSHTGSACNNHYAELSDSFRGFEFEGCFFFQHIRFVFVGESLHLCPVFKWQQQSIKTKPDVQYHTTRYYNGICVYISCRPNSFWMCIDLPTELRTKLNVASSYDQIWMYLPITPYTLTHFPNISRIKQTPTVDTMSGYFEHRDDSYQYLSLAVSHRVLKMPYCVTKSTNSYTT